MKGWFDAFRTDGGPTLYSYSNRTPVTGDVPSICLYVVFATIYIAFLIIFPGIRKERFTTFLSVTLSVFVGFSICASQYGSSWHVADTSITSYYRAFSREKVTADLGIHIGLMHFNVTLQGWTTTNASVPQNVSYPGEDIDFNERFHWESATEVQEDYRAALVKGLPFPILTVAEYLNMDEEGFSWGRQYRLAGHYASVFLWFSFVSWMLTMVLFMMVPRYGAYKMVVTGGLLLTTNLIYYLLIPSNPIMIRFEDQIVMFTFGWDFWRIFGAGLVCGVVGSVIAIIDFVYPHKFSTILEVDYDTPYDRHIIIEESHDTRKKKGVGSLEQPTSINQRVLRTLSRRGRNSDDAEPIHRHHSYSRETRGLDNRGFEMDPPKSPWRYPYLMPRTGDPDLPPLRGALASAFAKNPALARLAAPNPTLKSPKSVSFRRQSRLETTFGLTEGSMRQERSDSKDSSGSSNFDIPLENSPPVNDFPNFQSQFRGIQRSDSQESGSTVSSFGLGLLSRTQSSRGHDYDDHDHEILSPSALSGRHLHVTQQYSSPSSRGPPSGASGGSDGHLPLSRMHYKHEPLGIPRASLDHRKNSSSGAEDSSAPSSRRGSNNSDSSSKSHAPSPVSAITSSSFGFDIAVHKRIGPDGHDNQSSSRRSSKEKVREREEW